MQEGGTGSVSGAERASVSGLSRPGQGNTSIRDLLSDYMDTEAVLHLLGSTEVGKVKKGVICKKSAG